MSKIRILLVEDDTNLGFVIQDNLSIEGYEVHLCRDGNEGLRYFNEHQYNLCVLDVMLPQKDGFSVAEDIRKINQDVPIIFLTAKSLTEDKVKGFQAGGDDYLTKPFDQAELNIRISRLLARTGQLNEKPVEEYQIGQYTFTLENFMLQYKNEQKKLTKKEGAIMKLLCENMNKVIERDLLLNLVWGKDDYFTGRSLDVFITKLRKYLNQDESVKIINQHGIGFKLEVPA